LKALEKTNAEEKFFSILTFTAPILYLHQPYFLGFEGLKAPCKFCGKLLIFAAIQKVYITSYSVFG
tara:strand:- start:4488 stop:4685 length:198 start_codon:yes stop_codon:yes gene_type:complete